MIFIAPSGSQQTEVAEPSVDIATDEVVDLRLFDHRIIEGRPAGAQVDIAADPSAAT